MGVNLYKLFGLEAATTDIELHVENEKVYIYVDIFSEFFWIDVH